MKPIRAHKIYIWQCISKYLFILLIPLMSAFFQAKGDYSVWIRGMWVDIVLVMLLMVFGIFSWNMFTVRIEDQQHLCIHQGVFLKKTRYIPLARISGISVEYPWYWIPIQASHLMIDTDAGDSKKVDFTMTLHHRWIELLMSKDNLSILQYTNLKNTFQPHNRYIFLFSFLASNSLTGILYSYVIITQARNIFGKTLWEKLLYQFAYLATVLNIGIPPVFTVVALMIVACWGISFLLNLLQHLRFSLKRMDHRLYVKAGTLTVRRCCLMISNINFVYLRQSLLLRWFNITSVFIHSTGYGKNKSKLSVVIPSGKKQFVEEKLKQFLPEFSFCKRLIKPKREDFSRFVFTPIMMIGGTLVVAVFAFIFFTGWHRLIWFFFITLEIPFCWWLCVKYYGYFFSGIGKNNTTVTLYYTHGFRIITSTIPIEKITLIQLTQSIYQRSTQSCGVKIFTKAEKTQKQMVVNLNQKEVLSLLGDLCGVA